MYGRLDILSPLKIEVVALTYVLVNRIRCPYPMQVSSLRQTRATSAFVPSALGSIDDCTYLERPGPHEAVSHIPSDDWSRDEEPEGDPGVGLWCHGLLPFLFVVVSGDGSERRGGMKLALKNLCSITVTRSAAILPGGRGEEHMGAHRTQQVR